ncbi:MAG: hypothetical protein K2O45_03310, partial [Oscillospiraceae bacterium]|nr:hypothetical protein [Oscillospiraceae bacterium]
GIVGRNDACPLLPRDDVIHNLQKFFSLRFLLAAAVLHIRKCFLLHFRAPPYFFVASILPYFFLAGEG